MIPGDNDGAAIGFAHHVDGLTNGGFRPAAQHNAGRNRTYGQVGRLAIRKTGARHNNLLLSKSCLAPGLRAFLV
jgi:hypothetical protein